jgi:hypothetical protein
VGAPVEGFTQKPRRVVATHVGRGRVHYGDVARIRAGADRETKDGVECFGIDHLNVVVRGSVDDVVEPVEVANDGERTDRLEIDDRAVGRDELQRGAVADRAIRGDHEEVIADRERGAWP